MKEAAAFRQGIQRAIRRGTPDGEKQFLRFSQVDSHYLTFRYTKSKLSSDLEKIVAVAKFFADRSERFKTPLARAGFSCKR